MKVLLLTTLLGASFQLQAATSWPQFRGPNSSGVAAKEKPPVEFNSGTNLLWKVAVPKGLSSPCISGNRIFLTAYENDKLMALGFDRETGKELWRREAPPGKPQDVHRSSSPAVATPVTDGDRVIMYFVPYGLVAYDFKGKELWRKPVPINIVMNGSGTSPAIMDDTVILNVDQDEGESFLLAVNARNGKTRWQTSRADFPAGSYTTPILWNRGRTEEAVVVGSLRVSGYDLKDGKERWTARVMTSAAVTPTPVVGDGNLFVMSRGVPPTAMGTFATFAEKNDKDNDGKVARNEAPAGFDTGVFRSIDRDKDGFISEKDWAALTNFFGKGDSGLFALREPGSGDITDTHVVWKATKGIAGISTPLFYQGRVYVVQDGGRVTCWDAKSGKAIYEQERLKADGEYYASPVAANGHVYFASSRGYVTVARAGDSLEVAARNELGESVLTTPAIVDDKIYVRSADHLWAFGR